MLSAQVLSQVQLSVIPWTIACQAALFMECSRKEYWSGLLCPTSGHLPDLRIEPVISCVSCNGRQILYHLATWEAQELPCDPTILLPSKYPKKQYHRKGNQWIQGLAVLTQTISEGKSQMTVTQQVTEGNQSRPA